MVSKLSFFMALAIEIILSHQPGKASGAESQSISSFFHVEEKFLRIGAHVFLFALLMYLGLLAFSSYWAVIGIAIWTILDEATKPIIKGRHFNLMDCGWNIVGAFIGGCLYLLLR